MAALFNRGETFYAQFFDPSGKRHQKSTHTKDKQSAEAKLREFERRAADPAYAAFDETTVQQALTELLYLRKFKEHFEETVKF